MKIWNLLYNLHHKDSLSKSAIQEVQDVFSNQPFLAELDIHRKFAKQELISLDDKLTILATQEFGSDFNDPYLYKKVPSHHVKESDLVPSVDNFEIFNNSFDNSTDQSQADDLNDENQHIYGMNKDYYFQPLLPKEVYVVEESDYVKFLSSFPSVVIKSKESHHNNQHVQTHESAPELMHEGNSFPVIESKDMFKPAPEDVNLTKTNDLIQTSLELPPNLSSESLGNLWALQGKYELAILMFERLSSENPEKSATFAAKIEKLKAENFL